MEIFSNKKKQAQMNLLFYEMEFFLKIKPQAAAERCSINRQYQTAWK